MRRERRRSQVAALAAVLAPAPAVVLATALLVVGVAACAPAQSPSPAPITTASVVEPASGVPAGTGAELVSPVTGVLIDVEAAGLAEVTAFTLRLDDGREVRFRIGTLENAAAFPPGHLAEHLATSSPVRVFFRGEGLGLVAYRIEDAG